jgi:hypothetical protein
MENVELDINKYTFNDILNLFKIEYDFEEDDLLKCKEIIFKLYSSNEVNIKYCELFNYAYKHLERFFLLKTTDSISKHFESKIKTNECYFPNKFDEHLITIHTEDRDVNKYPLENNFEIELPSPMKYVSSIELFDITLPTFYYNISEYMQNNKLWLSVPLYFNEPIEIIIQSGYYTNDELCVKLNEIINSSISVKLYNIGAFINENSKYENFYVSYNKNRRIFNIKNYNDDFILFFDKQSEYNKCNINCWKMKQGWGIGYYLGFLKKRYTSIYDEGLNNFYIESSNISNVEMNDTIYMEINEFNWIDEIVPFSTSTSTCYDNDYNGTVNSAFAKLSIRTIDKTYVPIKKYKRNLPHIVEKISKLKFRFRYHNGMNVDFLGQNFNFSLKINYRYGCD